MFKENNYISITNRDWVNLFEDEWRFWQFLGNVNDMQDLCKIWIKLSRYTNDGKYLFENGF